MSTRRELAAGAYSAFVLHENGTWEQPTYRVPAGWTENELRRALEAESRKVLRVTGICEDPDAPEDVLRSLPDVEIEPDPSPRCEKCQAYEHEADECPHDDDETCTACGRPSLDCSRNPCPAVIADRGDLTPAELSTNSDAVIDRLAGLPRRYCSGCGSRVGHPHASNCDVEPGGEYVLIDQCDEEAPPCEVMRVAVLSTRHLSAEEAQRRPADWPTHCHESEYGFVAHVGPEVPFDEVLGDDVERWPGLMAAAAWARAFGLAWVRFDADGPDQPGLPRWEW